MSNSPTVSYQVQPIGQTLALGAVLILIYIPFGYFIDSFFYKRFSARQQRARGRG